MDKLLRFYLEVMYISIWSLIFIGCCVLLYIIIKGVT